MENLNTSIFIGTRGILTMLWEWRLTCLAKGTSLCRILVKSPTRTCTPRVIRSFIMLWQWWMERGRRTKPLKLKRYLKISTIRYQGFVLVAILYFFLVFFALLVHHSKATTNILLKKKTLRHLQHNRASFKILITGKHTHAYAHTHTHTLHHNKQKLIPMCSKTQLEITPLYTLYIQVQLTVLIVRF